MMKFKNTLIIFLGIIAIIFAGCKEKKATHESGTLEEPKVETYEENGVNFTRESYIGYEITYPSLDKKIVDKTFIQYGDNQYTCYGYEKPAHSVNETYKGEPYHLWTYHKLWTLPDDISRENLSDVTYTVYNRTGTFVKELQTSKVIKNAQLSGGYKLDSSCTVTSDYMGDLYLCIVSEYYGFVEKMTSETMELSFDQTIIGVNARYADGSTENAYYSIEYYPEGNKKEPYKIYYIYRLTLEE